VLIMLVACLGFGLRNLPLLLVALFLMGAHSTFFAPAKYGFLPERLAAGELVGGNAMLEMGTFIAILGGTILGGVLASRGDRLAIDVALVSIAAIGVITSLYIPRGEPVRAKLAIDWNPWRTALDNLSAAQRNRTVFLSVLGVSWFWFYGVLVLAQVPLYAHDVLHGGGIAVTLLLTCFSLGVGIGSLWCERLSGRQLEIGLVPLGSIGLTAFGIDLYFATPTAAPNGASLMALIGTAGVPRVLLDITLIGVTGGLYIVPLYALMQRRTPTELISRVISANSVWNALFMVVAAGFGALLIATGISVPTVFLICALLNFCVAAFIYSLVPEFLLRFLAWVLARVLYRVRTQGLDHVPTKGAAILVCNHVSFADALVLSAGVARPMRFVMEASIFRLPVAGAIFRGMKAIPVASAREDRAVREAAFAAIHEALGEGALVCIFPEGRLTGDGEIGEFKPGILRVLSDRPVPVIPAGLSGLWNSSFSRRRSGLSRWLPRALWSRIDLRIGPAIEPSQVTLADLRAQVEALRGARQ
jgi:1-acyl-sn-glycerol-3-phosphate acyltransferase